MYETEETLIKDKNSEPCIKLYSSLFITYSQRLLGRINRMPLMMTSITEAW